MQSKAEKRESPIVDLKKAIKFCTTFCLAEKEECKRCPLIRKYPELEKYSKLKKRSGN
jgi:endonuclease III